MERREEGERVSELLSSLAPHSPEPYLTLSTVYEELGDKEKLLQVKAG